MINDNRYCVLATASIDAKPEAALIEYVPGDGDNLFFECGESFRKYTNLINNPHTSIVISDGLYSIQMDGKVKEVAREKSKEAINLMIEKYGRGSNFYNDKDISFFQFHPSWIRLVYRDNAWPPEFFVIKES